MTSWLFSNFFERLNFSSFFKFIILSIERWCEMDSMFFWDMLDGVLNLGENANGNEEDAHDPQ